MGKYFVDLGNGVGFPQELNPMEAIRLPRATGIISMREPYCFVATKLIKSFYSLAAQLFDRLVSGNRLADLPLCILQTQSPRFCFASAVSPQALSYVGFYHSQSVL
jgi:hypothetical protein